MNRPEEPLNLSAPMARRMAEGLCRRDPSSGEDCSWYHGLWQDLRVIGLAASPEHQAEFYLNAFQKLGLRHACPRVLISGAADYSILAHALWACRESGFEPALTVLDLCPTPLHFNSWYAERCHCKIQTVRGNILDFQPDEPFDVICSHSFMGQFVPELRPALVEKWHSLLRPGGTAIAVNRVRPAGVPREISFSSDAGRTLAHVVAERMADLHPASPGEQEQILHRTAAYTKNSRTYAISEGEFTALFDKAGFHKEDFALIFSSNPRNRDIQGKAIPKDATHACLVARRTA